MPAQYVAIRDSLVKQGKPYDKAQEIAARTYHKLTGRTVQQVHHGPPSRGGKGAAKHP